MGLALDTSALVEVERRGHDLLALIPEDAGPVYVPALVVAELWIGVELADAPARRAWRMAKIDALLTGCSVLPFDESVAPTYARLYATLRRSGTPIPANDLAIAALAVHFGHELLVGPRREEDFARVPGLALRVLGRP